MSKHEMLVEVASRLWAGYMANPETANWEMEACVDEAADLIAMCETKMANLNERLFKPPGEGES